MDIVFNTIKYRYNTIMNEDCKLTGIEGHTLHSTRHGMGMHLIKKSGNSGAVQRQFRHTNPEQ